MIDLIVLLLKQDSFQINDPNKFVPSAVAKAMADKAARWITNNKSSAVYGIQSKQNPTKKELLAGIYKPRLTLFFMKMLKQIMLKIELSLPKLFYGNNFQELKRKDLPLLLQKLSSILATMGVIVDPLQLSAAPVSAVHYSKNIVLRDGSTPYHYIQKIKEANIKMSLDTNQTDYRNEGHSYKWHCNSYEVVFYDKIKDLEKSRQSEKRSVEKDNAIQLNLFSKLRKKKKKFEILRMEVRLNKRQKMKQIFAKLGIKTDLSLKSLFKPAISKKILLHYLDELENKRLPILDHKIADDRALFADLILNNPNLSAKKIMQVYGLAKALKVMNMRELKAMLCKNNAKNWHRLINETRELKLLGLLSPFRMIREFLRKYNPLKI